MTNHMLDVRQFATIIAALRYWQRKAGKGSGEPEELMIATGEGFEPLGDAEIDELVEHLQFDGDDEDEDLDEEFDEEDAKCDDCGAPTDDGEGYDGKCGNCADKEHADEACSTCGDALGEDSYEGMCSDCAEREVEKMSARGMAANPKPAEDDKGSSTRGTATYHGPGYGGKF